MKVLLIVLVLYAQTLSISTLTFGRDSINLDALQNGIESKCSTDGNKKLFKQSVNNFDRCISHSLENATIKSIATENSKNFCSFLQESQFYLCLKKFTTDISPCLNENEIYIQRLLLDAYDSGYEEVCGINGESNFQYLYDKINGTQDCLQVCSNLFFSMGSCTGNLNVFTQLEKGVINLNKPDVCRDLESFHKCSTQVLEGVCNEEFSRFTNLFLHPLLVSCNDLNSRK